MNVTTASSDKKRLISLANFIKKKYIRQQKKNPRIASDQEWKIPVDSDWAFFKSLLHITKQFSNDQRLDFQIKVLETIKNIKNL